MVKGDRFTTTGMGAEYSGLVEIDGSRTPKHFTLRFTEGPEKGNANPGIYEIEGDTWRLCLNTRGGARPKAFATTPGSGLALETLRRGAVRARRAKAAAAAVAAPKGDAAPELSGEWQMQSCVMNGAALPDDAVGYCRRMATDSEITVKAGPQVMLKAVYRVDRSAAPAQMNYTLAHGPQAGKGQSGIYRFEGDVLETCFAAPGEERPADFRSVAGDRRTHTVWKKK